MESLPNLSLWCLRDSLETCHPERGQCVGFVRSEGPPHTLGRYGMGEQISRLYSRLSHWLRTGLADGNRFLYTLDVYSPFILVIFKINDADVLL